jgi:hypothetical protein
MGAGDIEVGDRVRVVDESFHWLSSDGLSEGDIATVKKSDDDWIKVENGKHWIKKGAFELTSKGSDLQMEADAIVVEVGRSELSEAIQKVAFENGWEWNSGIKETKELNADLLVFGKESYIQTGITHSNLPNMTDRPKFELPQDWSKVVEFLEQDDEPITINGYEVEVEEKAMKRYIHVGCWRCSLGKLQQWADLCQEIGITEGAVRIDGEVVDVEEMFDVINELKEMFG